MKLIKRFYFPDGSYAEPQEMEQEGDCFFVSSSGVSGEEAIGLDDIKYYPNYFSAEEPEAEEIEAPIPLMASGHIDINAAGMVANTAENRAYIIKLVNAVNRLNKEVFKKKP